MELVYLDNAATTPMLPEVIEVMSESMKENYGNPSSTHQFGRKAKSAIETVRKNIAKQFNVSSSEIIFTAGGTEADNLIIKNAVENLGVETIITSRIEHHAVLHSVKFLQEKYNIDVEFVDVDEFGAVVLSDLEDRLIKVKGMVLVSLMWVNNEIGNLLPLKEVSRLCKKYNAFFHSDTVQGIGHYELDLQEIEIDFITASAHKFHGPKGVGFAYFRKGFGVQPMIHGGNQEKGVRSSTENVHAILGMGKAFQVAYKNLEIDTLYIKEIKRYLIEGLKSLSNNIEFNGYSSSFDKSSYTIVSVRFPIEDKMMLFNLDLYGIAVSGGSACQSGSNKGSHVLSAFLSSEEVKKTSVRFSFSKYTLKRNIDYLLDFFKERLKK